MLFVHLAIFYQIPAFVKNLLYDVFSLVSEFFRAISDPERAMRDVTGGHIIKAEVSIQTKPSGVALMENFDAKQRGLHQGTSTIERAEINPDNLGVHSFFDAVELAN